MAKEITDNLLNGQVVLIDGDSIKDYTPIGALDQIQGIMVEIVETNTHIKALKEMMVHFVNTGDYDTVHLIVSLMEKVNR